MSAGAACNARCGFNGAHRVKAKALLAPHDLNPKDNLMPKTTIDWSQCEDVESVPGRLSGAWVIKGTRVPAQAVVDNAKDGFTAEQIATEIFELPVERVRGVLRFAKIAQPANG